MADMDSVLLINTLDQEDGIYLSATLGPKGHLCSHDELIAMCFKAINDHEAEEINLEY